MSPRMQTESSMATGGDAGQRFAVDSRGVERWAPASLAIDPWTILRLARYRRRDLVPPPIWESAERMAARAEALAVPAARLRSVRVSAAGPDGATLLEGPAFSGRAVGALLTGCRLAVVFVLTLGPRLEAETAALADRRELLEAFLLDTAGWAAIEAAIRGLRLDLAARARMQGWRLTHRLGPGHRDWPLSEQSALVGLLDPPERLVRVSEHGVLVPFKSISGVFGLAAAQEH